MKFFNIILLIISLTLITLTPSNSQHSFLQPNRAATKRVSRFLLQKVIMNPRTADNYCNHDNQICNYGSGGENKNCCNNKCVDTESDSDNCGTCGNKCGLAGACCRGECVNVGYDKRHCGFCNNVCMVDGDCVYGMCDYAA